MIFCFFLFLNILNNAVNQYVTINAWSISNEKGTIPFSIENNPKVIRTSCANAAIAPKPNCQFWNHKNIKTRAVKIASTT